MRELPTFEDIRADAHRRLGDTQDTLRSDWRTGHGPNDDQAEAITLARRHIAAAKAALDHAARAATRPGDPVNPPTR